MAKKQKRDEIRVLFDSDEDKKLFKKITAKADKEGRSHQKEVLVFLHKQYK